MCPMNESAVSVGTPVAERDEQLLSRVARDRGLVGCPEARDGFAHLREVLGGVWGHGEVVVEAASVNLGKGSDQIGRDRLDEFLARHLGHARISTVSNAVSSAARTLVRARCSST